MIDRSPDELLIDGNTNERMEDRAPREGDDFNPTELDPTLSAIDDTAIQSLGVPAIDDV